MSACFPLNSLVPDKRFSIEVEAQRIRSYCQKESIIMLQNKEDDAWIMINLSDPLNYLPVC